MKWCLRHSPFLFLNIGCYFASIGDTVAKIRSITFFYRLWNWVYGIHHSIFRTLEVVLRRLEVWSPRHWRYNLFSGFQIGFTSFTVLFLEHWRLFCIDWSYGLPSTGENPHSPNLKMCLGHLTFYFKTLEVILRRLEVRLPRDWR